MSKDKTQKCYTEVSVIGSGIAGITTAFHLGQKGYKVNLIDPKINSKINNLNPQNGSQASLGILMGNSYKRTKGRSFYLRDKSMKLWRKWLERLNYSNIEIEKPFIKLASSEKEYESMINLIKIKKNYNIELLSKNSLEFWSLIFEKKLIGGFISHEDGRINPIKLMQILLKKIDDMKIKKINDKVTSIKINGQSLNKKWRINLENNEPINQDFIVICTALNSQELLQSLGHKILLEPILGQVIELELNTKNKDWKKWPAVLNYQSINFIHHNPLHIYMGATIEPGLKSSHVNKQKMLTINNTSPEWFKKAKISQEWSGLRARPLNEPAPLLKELDIGLLVNTGHYRNGILLAPACAEWVGLTIESQRLKAQY